MVDSSDVRIYQTIARRLGLLNTKGLGESPEAEELRTKMDDLWKKLSESERLRINKNVKLPKV